MVGKFALKKAKNGQFFFSLQASNGQIILGSGFHQLVRRDLWIS